MLCSLRFRTTRSRLPLLVCVGGGRGGDSVCLIDRCLDFPFGFSLLSCWQSASVLFCLKRLRLLFTAVDFSSFLNSFLLFSEKADASSLFLKPFPLSSFLSLTACLLVSIQCSNYLCPDAAALGLKNLTEESDMAVALSAGMVFLLACFEWCRIDCFSRACSHHGANDDEMLLEELNIYSSIASFVCQIVTFSSLFVSNRLKLLVRCFIFAYFSCSFAFCFDR